jgi:hypothetical protein
MSGSEKLADLNLDLGSGPVQVRTMFGQPKNRKYCILVIRYSTAFVLYNRKTVSAETMPEGLLPVIDSLGPLMSGLPSFLLQNSTNSPRLAPSPSAPPALTNQDDGSVQFDGSIRFITSTNCL